MTGISALCISLFSAVLIHASAGPAAFGQVRVISEADRQKMMEMRRSGRVSAEQMKQLMEAQKAAAAQAQPPSGDASKPGESDEKEDGDDKKSEGEKKEEDDAPATVKRPTESSAKANPEELKVRPNDKGLVEFSFHGQPWAEVLQWYSEVAKLSLDWQELPGDFLNLTTQRPYTVPETRDLLNSRLLARGFTMVARGDVLSVVKIEKLDPSLIPRVDPDDLEDYLPHDFVRVRFDIPRTMEPAKAQEDAKILLSPNAKATPLLASRRLLIIDAVANLRDVRDLLYSEQMAADSDIRPELFQIRYRRADYVAEQVMVVLGMDPASRKKPQELQLEQARMQLLTQLAQQKKDVTKMLAPDGPPVHFAVDRHTNTIMVNAPPPEMEIIKRSIRMFDVPYGTGVASDDGGGELEFREYKTKSASTDAIVTALKEIGALHPLTQLQSDTRTKTIFATATPSDHATIKSIIEKLDGKGRKSYPIQLSRRYRAIEVAGTVQTLLVGEDEDASNNRNRRYVYNYNYGSSGDEEEEEFRILPDVERNRLLLWATEEEYEEVVGLLQSIGAISNPNVAAAGGDQLRVMEPRSPEDLARLLQRLKQTLGEEVEIIAPKKKEEPKVESKPSGNETEKQATDDQLTRIELRPFIAGSRRTWLAQTNQPADDSTSNSPGTGSGEASETASPAEVQSDPPAGANSKPGETPTPSRPKVKIVVTDDGRILLNSEDPVALDRIEALIQELEPPGDDFEIFYVEHADAWDVWYNLKEYFADELSGGSDDEIMRYLYGFGGSDTSDATLGRAPKMRFIWDPDSNSVLVQNASQAQLQVIRKLVKIYDRPIKEDDVAKRRTEAIPILYSRASDIATALKEAYRDLLSSKDKEFQNREGEQGGRGGRPQVYRLSLTGDDSSNRNSPVKMQFEGALAIGVDEVSNTLIISAEANIFDSICTIVDQLDQRANPETTVALHEVSGAIDAEGLREALQAAISQPWTGGKPEQSSRGGGRRGGNDPGRDRGRDRRR